MLRTAAEKVAFVLVTTSTPTLDEMAQRAPRAEQTLFGVFALAFDREFLGHGLEHGA